MNNCRSLVLLTCAFIAGLSSSTGFAADLDFDEYVQRADTAKKRGDWESVASQIAQAINHPDLPRAGAVRSAVHLDYGRAMGVLCHFDEAEKYLLLAKQIAQQGNVSTFHAVVELGALNVGQKKYAVAAGWYSEMMPMLERESLIKMSPLLLADALEKFAIALAATDKPEEAESQRRAAAKIRETGLKAPSATITPYGAKCAQH